MGIIELMNFAAAEEHRWRKVSIEEKWKCNQLGVRIEEGEWECKKQKVSFVEGGQLLLGILDETTIDHIAPKLPWTTFHKLLMVTHGWQQAIQSRQVYDARVCSQSAKTLVMIICKFTHCVKTICLYSSSYGTCYHLPPTLGLTNGFPWTSRCIPLDAKVYVLGRMRGLEVYVLDLSMLRQWKRCASMVVHKVEFVCGVIDGKIYVFGGRDGNDILCGSKVYDPKSDAWSPSTHESPPDASDLGSYISDPQTITMGEELLVNSGNLCNRRDDSKLEFKQKACH